MLRAQMGDILQTPFTRNAAANHEEVLIFGEIPPEAIIGFYR